MEDFLKLTPILIFVLISVVSAMLKKNRDQQPGFFDEEAEDDDEQPLPEESEAVKPLSKQAAAEKAKEKIKKLRADYRTDSFRGNYKKKHPPGASETGQAESIEKASRGYGRQRSGKKVFRLNKDNIRTAVIYSEILKRKY